MKKNTVTRANLVILFLAVLVVWMGAEALLAETQDSLFSVTDWTFALATVVFGSMLGGVAINKLSQSHKDDSSGTVKNVKNGKRKTS